MIKKFSASEIKSFPNEVFRYLGYKNTNGNYDVPENISVKVENAICEMQKILKSQIVYEIFDLSIYENEISFAEKKIISKNLATNLKGCKQVILFASTIGALVDKLIIKSAKIDSTFSVIYQATGSMFIESVVEKFCENIQKKFCDAKLHPRYSPGYGDLDLSTQKILFSLLNCEQKIGLTLNDSLLMSPEKSVTAFIGIENLL